MELLAAAKGLQEKESHVECLCAKPLSRSWSIVLSSVVLIIMLPVVVLCHMDSRMAQGTYPCQDSDLREASLSGKTQSFTSLNLAFGRQRELG